MRGFWKRKERTEKTPTASVATVPANGNGDAKDKDTKGKDDPRGGVATTTTTLRDVLVVTYSVPMAQVKPHLPEGLRPDLLPAFDGEPMAFVQTLFAYHEEARWSPLPGRTGSSYHQVTYRILTRKEGQRGAFVLRTFVSSQEFHIVARRAIEQTIEHARFTVFVDGNPARASYRMMRLRAVGDRGKTELDVNALSETPPPPIPFANTDQMAEFLLDREHVYFKAAAPKSGYGLAPIRWGKATPVSATIESARLAPLTDAGIVDADALTRPLSVFLLPAVTVVSAPPRLVKLV